MAAEVSKKRAAIVIATEATVSSHAYRDALQRHGLQALEKACPLFVPLVEEGWIEHPVTEQVARIYLDEATAQAPDGADVLVLACTHYPLIAPLLRRIVPAGNADRRFGRIDRARGEEDDRGWPGAASRELRAASSERNHFQ